MIPKRPPKKTWFYRSNEYKTELRLKFYKWSHIKAATIFYGKFTTAYNPYALDWMDRGMTKRSKVMHCRANAMFDSMRIMLQMRMDFVPAKTKRKAINKALKAWAQRQRQEEGKEYIVKGDTIVRV